MAEETSYHYELKIPKERIAVLIGKDGEVKRALEHRAHCVLRIDSKEGDVFIEGMDPLSLYTLREVIRAVGRGFNPDVASLLFKTDYLLEIIPLADVARTRNDELRLKGRVIGAGGKSRRVIESLTECSLCVYGKTIGIIGSADHMPLARKALEMLLSGSTHATVYRWLERQRRKLHRESF
jgi:ribosomal RNA assembly protein